jgi:hypothetical protein
MAGRTASSLTAGRRRADVGAVRLSQRDIDGLLLAGEHYGAPLDLLAAGLGVQADRMPAIAARWRRTGYAATGRLGPGPAWCWLTRDGMAATGLGFPTVRLRWDGWRTSAPFSRPGCGWRPARPGPTGRRGGSPSGGCAPPGPRPGVTGTFRTPRSTGPAFPAPGTPGKSGLSRSS